MKKQLLTGLGCLLLSSAVLAGSDDAVTLVSKVVPPASPMIHSYDSGLQTKVLGGASKTEMAIEFDLAPNHKAEFGLSAAFAPGKNGGVDMSKPANGCSVTITHDDANHLVATATNSASVNFDHYQCQVEGINGNTVTTLTTFVSGQ